MGRQAGSHYPELNRQFKRGEAPLFNILPSHDKNIYPYHGEGD